jgi:hypothetical protein
MVFQQIFPATWTNCSATPLQSVQYRNHQT